MSDKYVSHVMMLKKYTAGNKLTNAAVLLLVSPSTEELARFHSQKQGMLYPGYVHEQTRTYEPPKLLEDRVRHFMKFDPETHGAISAGDLETEHDWYSFEFNDINAPRVRIES